MCPGASFAGLHQRLPGPGPASEEKSIYSNICVCAGSTGFPGGSMVKNLPLNAGDAGSIPGSGRSPGEGKWHPTPAFLPVKPHGQRSPTGSSPWDHKRIATKQQRRNIHPGS